jgi:hypothetical protein
MSQHTPIKVIPAKPDPARPVITRTQDAFIWLAWWHTGGMHKAAVDRSNYAREVLGPDAYRVITTVADDWYQRHTQGGAA